MHQFRSDVSGGIAIPIQHSRVVVTDNPLLSTHTLAALVFVNVVDATTDTPPRALGASAITSVFQVRN